MYTKQTSPDAPARLNFTPMTLAESNALSAQIEYLAEQIDGEVVENPDSQHGWLVRVIIGDSHLEFIFDHSAGSETDVRGRKPDAPLVISALWGRAAIVRRGETAFYKSFAGKTESGETKKPSKSVKEQWAEWSRCAQWCWQVWGQEFGLS